MSKRFTDNGDGTVLDNVTKLMWQRAVGPWLTTQRDATNYARRLALAGYRNWRLPSYQELRDLDEYEWRRCSSVERAFGLDPAQSLEATECWSPTSPDSRPLDVRCVRDSKSDQARERAQNTRGSASRKRNRP